MLTLVAFCALNNGIVSPQGGGFVGATDDALATLGRQRRVCLTVPGFGMLLDMAGSTNLKAQMPERLLHGVQGLTLRSPPLAVSGFTRLLAWHARTHADPRQRLLRDRQVQACAGEQTPPAGPAALQAPEGAAA